MTIRSEGDLVWACSSAQDLTNLVTTFLNMWRTHANGVNKVYVPSENYTVVFNKMKEGFICVTLVYTKTQFWQEPDYYDVDSDYFDESWGASNISGYTTHSKRVTMENGIYNIPFGALLQSKENMEKYIKNQAKIAKEKEAEEKRLKEIKELETRLNELKK